MARKRMLWGKITESAQFGRLTYRQALGFILVFGKMADDQGRFRADPDMLRATMFPWQLPTREEMEADIRAWRAAGLIYLYQADGERLGQVVKWWKHQGGMKFAMPSNFLPPPGWTDREKYNSEGKLVYSNWDEPGGFVDDCPPESAAAEDNTMRIGLSPQSYGDRISQEKIDQDKSGEDSESPDPALVEDSPIPAEVSIQHYQDQDVNQPFAPGLKMSLADAWQAALNELQLQMTKSSFKTYLEGSCVVGRSGSIVIVEVKDRETQQWLNGRLKHSASLALSRLDGSRVIGVQFIAPENRHLQALSEQPS